MHLLHIENRRHIRICYISGTGDTYGFLTYREQETHTDITCFEKKYRNTEETGCLQHKQNALSYITENNEK